MEQSLDVLCLNFGQKEGRAALRLVTALRGHGLRADLYPSATKMQKQFKYADKRNVPYVILLGESEIAQGEFTVKDMAKGEQTNYSLTDLEAFVTKVKQE